MTSSPYQHGSRLASLSIETVIEAVANYYQTTPAAFGRRRSDAPGRDIAAWLARRLTSATLRELAVPFGLGHPDSVSNLVRRANVAIGKSQRLRQDIKTIRNRLAKTVKFRAKWQENAAMNDLYRAFSAPVADRVKSVSERSIVV